MNYSKAFIVFIIGIILSYVGAVLLHDAGFGAAIAVCYIGAIIIGHK